MLVCPVSRQSLSRSSRRVAEERSGAPLVPVRRWPVGQGAPEPEPLGPTDEVLLREDNRLAYPVVRGLPILLVPEALAAPEAQRPFDLGDPRYAEAYEEMEFYNEAGYSEAEHVEGSELFGIVAAVMRAGPSAAGSFPHPWRAWMDARYDCGAQWDAYRHIAPVAGRRVLQLGGTGVHAVKFLLGGASEAWLITPMLGELEFTRSIARAAGVADRLRCVAAVAEELPFAPDYFDRVFSGGCLHHMDTAAAFSEVARVLRGGGRFGAVDPWRAPLYGVGTRLLGKREPGVHCRPLTRARTAPLASTFREGRVVQHGTLTRYPLLALEKLGFRCPFSIAWHLMRLDDWICSVLRLRRWGSSAATLATK